MKMCSCKYVQKETFKAKRAVKKCTHLFELCNLHLRVDVFVVEVLNFALLLRDLRSYKNVSTTTKENFFSFLSSSNTFSSSSLMMSLWCAARHSASCASRCAAVCVSCSFAVRSVSTCTAYARAAPSACRWLGCTFTSLLCSSSCSVSWCSSACGGTMR